MENGDTEFFQYDCTHTNTNTHSLCNSYYINKLCIFPHIAFMDSVWICQWIPIVSPPYKSLQRFFTVRRELRYYGTLIRPVLRPCNFRTRTVIYFATNPKLQEKGIFLTQTFLPW